MLPASDGEPVLMGLWWEVGERGLKLNFAESR
jgi:hypothetical protein